MKITGTCHLILSPGCKLKCKEGSGCNKGTTLNIYSSDVTSQGTINCDISKDNYAAIGGDEDKSSGNINIHNGRIIAESNYGGAGIGGGDNGSGGEVIIAGGDVVANAGDGKSQAIGGGRRKGGGNVVNKSGSVLPSTGGPGTRLFRLFGILLVLSAGILMITRRRA